MSRPLAAALLLLGTSAAHAALPAAEKEVTSSEASTVATEGGFSRVHLAAAGGVDFIGRAVVPELGAAFCATRFLDLGVTVALGSSLAVHVDVGLHTSWAPQSLLRPFVQLRGTASFGSLGFGGGLWAGASLELGPGRLKLGPAAYALTAGPGYSPFSLLGVLGYELDLLRPATSTVARPLAREPTRGPETQRPTLLRARLVDLGDKPVSGSLRFTVGGRERTYDASPSVELELPPGDYRVEAEAQGYLIRGRTVTLQAQETLTTEFVLRPVPRVKTATLAEREVTVSQAIMFEFARATLLKESSYILEEVADILLRHPELQQVRVEGHTDDVGSADANQQLSEDRALAVTQALIAMGVEPTRLVAQGFGRSKPLTSNRSEQGRARNRRVQFKLITE